MSKDLPPEIWREIFASACTDDGYTGRALSLVSRRIQLLSRSYKYQSLAVTRAKRIFRLLPILLETPEDLRRIRYLLLATPNMLTDDASEDEKDGSYTEDDESSDTESDHASEGAVGSPVPSAEEYDFEPLTEEESVEVADDLLFFDTPDGQPMPGAALNEGDDMVPSVAEEIEIAENALINTVNDIITMASPSLINLTLFLALQQVPYGSFLTTPVPLPELRELSIFCRVLNPYTEPPILANSVTLFPALKSLHVGWGVYRKLLPRITHFAPRLVNLRFPFDSSLFEKVRDEGQDPWHFLSILPSSIDNVLIDLEIDEEFSGDKFDARYLGLDKHPNPRARLAIRPQEDIPSIKQNWLNGIMGRLGEWEYEAYVDDGGYN